MLLLLQDLPPVPEQSTTRGRITIYCIAESLNRAGLEKRLKDQGPKCLVQAYPDVSPLAHQCLPLCLIQSQLSCGISIRQAARRYSMGNSSSQAQKPRATSFTLTMAVSYSGAWIRNRYASHLLLRSWIANLRKPHWTCRQHEFSALMHYRRSVPALQKEGWWASCTASACSRPGSRIKFSC